MAKTTRARKQGSNHTSARGLTPERANRIIRRLKTPAAASRAAERVYVLSRRASEQAAALLALSEALHEQRHVLLATWRDDIEGAAEHARNVRESVRRATATATLEGSSIALKNRDVRAREAMASESPASSGVHRTAERSNGMISAAIVTEYVATLHESISQALASAHAREQQGAPQGLVEPLLDALLALWQLRWDLPALPERGESEAKEVAS